MDLANLAAKIAKLTLRLATATGEATATPYVELYKVYISTSTLLNSLRQHKPLLIVRYR